MKHKSAFRASFPYAIPYLARMARMARGLLTGAMVLGSSVGAVAISTGCSQTPPPKWAQGGVPLELQPAVWERQTEFVQVQKNGYVILNDRLVFILDRNGRVHDAIGDPYAVLEPGNRLSGNNNWNLGTVTMNTATPVSGLPPWITIFPSGKVIRKDFEGYSFEDGYWSGCNGPMIRTCTLVTHLILLYEHIYKQQQTDGQQTQPVVEPSGL